MKTARITVRVDDVPATESATTLNDLENAEGVRRLEVELSKDRAISGDAATDLTVLIYLTTFGASWLAQFTAFAFAHFGRGVVIDLTNDEPVVHVLRGSTATRGKVIIKSKGSDDIEVSDPTPSGIETHLKSIPQSSSSDSPSAESGEAAVE